MTMRDPMTMRAWQVLDALIGLTMLVLSLLLVRHALATT